VNYWKPILAAVVIFAAGFITGGLTLDLRRTPSADAASWSPKPQDQPQAGWPPRFREGSPREGGPFRDGPPGTGREKHLEDLTQRMEKDLGLTPEQRDQVEAIIRGTHERVRALVDGVRPETQAEFRRMESEIKALLTAEQAAKFDELAQQRRSRMIRR
jgi:Spy/CpxP family protein refolding chaperone